VYRYGFNGQEISDEINPSLTTAEYWEYDSRIGRRWNIEPETSKYPQLSPYSCFNNNPISFSDVTGKEPDPPTTLTWKPFTADRLRHLAYKAGVGLRTGGIPVLFNQAVGAEFEKAVGNMFNLPKNTTSFTYGGKTVIPDFVGRTDVVTIGKGSSSLDSYNGVFYEGVDLASFADAKGGYNVTLDGNNGQLRTMIDVIGSMKSPTSGKQIRKTKQGGALYLLTPAGTAIDPAITKYGKDNGVVVATMQAFENPDKEGEIKFSHPHITHNLTHAIADALFGAESLSTETGNINFKNPPKKK